MTDFIELFIQETVATIDGMMGRVAVLSHKEDGPVSADLLASPFAKVVVGVSLGGSEVSSLTFIMPENLATALPDFMMGGEGDTGTVSYTHLTLPTIIPECRSRWSPYH